MKHFGHAMLALTSIVPWTSSLFLRVCANLLQLCRALCDPMDYTPLGSSVHSILQARILEWVAMPSSRGSFQPRDGTQVSCTAGGFFTIWATREVKHMGIYIKALENYLKYSVLMKHFYYCDLNLNKVGVEFCWESQNFKRSMLIVRGEVHILRVGKVLARQ